MWTLAIDTSTTLGSLAVAMPGSPPLTRQWQREKTHSEWITATLNDLLNEARISTSDIRKLIVSVGPGSFTGLRVGVNLAKTLAYSHPEIKLFAISSLRVLAEGGRNQNLPILVAMNAFKNLMYVARYQKNVNGQFETLTPPCAMTVQDLGQITAKAHWSAGDGLNVFAEQLEDRLRPLLLHSGLTFPLAELILKAEVLDPGCVSPEAWKSLKPLYIRASEAEEKLKRGLLKPIPKF